MAADKSIPAGFNAYSIEDSGGDAFLCAYGRRLFAPVQIKIRIVLNRGNT